MENASYPKNAEDLGTRCSNSSRNENFFITSPIPEICKQQHCILGIDEAGRGPVLGILTLFVIRTKYKTTKPYLIYSRKYFLGPMVYGICYCVKSKEDDLKETGCDDSKSMTELKRESIFEKICKHSEYIGWEVEVISPAVISSSMYHRSVYKIILFFVFI